MKRWIHASSIIDPYNVSQYIPKKYQKGIIEIEVNADFDNARNRTVNYYTAWFSDTDCVSGVGVTQFVKNLREYVDKKNQKEVKASSEMPAGYLETTRFTSPQIKTDDQRNVLEAIEIAISEKFRQFDKMNEITMHLTSDTHWQGIVDQYEEGYYIQLEGTRSSFSAFVEGDHVIRKPRKLGDRIARYEVEGYNGRVDYIYRKRG